MPARKSRTEPETPKYAHTSEVEAFAAGLKKSYLLCRELGHNWVAWTAHVIDNGGFERVLRCSRCHTERHQLLTPRGHVLTNAYKYADGYQHKGMGRIIGDGRDALRLESISRTMVETRMRDRGQQAS